MKKLFYSLSLLLACGVAANAAVPQMQKMQNIPGKPVSLESVKKTASNMKFTRIGGESSKKKAKKGLPSSAEAYYGYWQWSGQNALSAVILPNEGILDIQPIEGTDSILIRGLDAIADLMTVRGGLTGYFKNGRIYIPEQPTSYDADPFQGDEPTMFFVWSLRNATEQEKEDYEQEHGPGSAESLGYIIEAPKGVDFFLALDNDDRMGGDYLTCVYYDDDDATITDEILLQSWTAASDEPVSRLGYWWFDTRITAVPLELFEFNPVEWEPRGNAVFEDAWIRELFQPGLIPAYEVPLYQNKLSENRYLLLDPYGPNTPYGEYSINESSEEGYLVFDMTNPNCILFEPFVYSLALDMSDSDEPFINDFYNYNEEGYYFFVQGTDIDQIESVMLDRGKDPTYLDNGTVYIYNAYFDPLPMGNLGSMYAWNGAEMSGSIKLPAGYDAVESILGENNDAAPEYYNLQGVRVNNPQAGQVLIVKKGNKATKQVIR